MKMLKLLSVGVLATVALLGCGSDDTTNAPANTGGDTVAPEFPEGQGQAPAATVAYPEGPFGVSKGSIIQNYQFIGYPNALADSSALALIHLGDFYNPTGADVFPAGSPYGEGTAKPKALLLQFAASWCGPCNDEAANILPPKFLEYKPQGGMFFMQLTDGKTPGKAATIKDLNSWTSKYDLDYPASVDPTYKMMPLFEAAAFPANFIIDTRTMTIVEVVSGSPSSSFWNKFENVLNGG